MSVAPADNNIAPTPTSETTTKIPIDQLDILSPSTQVLLELLNNDDTQSQRLVESFHNAIIGSASNGDSDMLEWLFETLSITKKPCLSDLGPDIYDSDGYPALLLATCFGHGDAVRVLIEFGADIHSVDPSGWTALHWASQNSDFPLTSYLLNHGADPTRKTFKSLSPLDLIKRGPEGDVIRETLRCAIEQSNAVLNKSLSSSGNQSSNNNNDHELELEQKQREAANNASNYSRTRALETIQYLQIDPGLMEYWLDHHPHHQQHDQPFDKLDYSNRHLDTTTLQILPAAESEWEEIFEPPIVNERPSHTLDDIHIHNNGHNIAAFNGTSKNPKNKLVNHHHQRNFSVPVLCPTFTSTTNSSSSVYTPTLLSTSSSSSSSSPPRSGASTPHLQHSGSISSSSSSDSSSSPELPPSHCPSSLSLSSYSPSLPSSSQNSLLNNNTFRWDVCLPHQMLIFTFEDIDSIVQTLVYSKSIPRSPHPRQRRFIPANTLYFLCRFAAYHCTTDLLSDLFYSAIDNIELCVKEKSSQHDISIATYWLSNCSQLLYYLRKDSLLSQLTKDHQVVLIDVINELFVVIVRELERRLDSMFEPCLLDHEAVPGFENIRFEDEWRFMKALTNRTSSKSRMSALFATSSPSSSTNNAPPPASPDHNNNNANSNANSNVNPSSSSSSSSRPTSPIPSMLNRKGSGFMNLKSSPSKLKKTSNHERRPSQSSFLESTLSQANLRRHMSMPPKPSENNNDGDDDNSVFSDTFEPTPSSTTINGTIPGGNNQPPLFATNSPKNVSQFLSSCLFLFECYEINTAIIVQILSQSLYWLSCEMTNRILSTKKYLCRSRAIQIRLNISSLEDWARLNKLPVKLVKTHFQMLDHLLQWLLCLSSERNLDGLLPTLQSLKTLNPLQLQKAAKDYRYEVDEVKMGDECKEYLQMMKFDWERRLRDIKEEEKVRHTQRLISGIFNTNFQRHEAMQEANRRQTNQTCIDECLLDSLRLKDYDPVGILPENKTENFDSRYMLPFCLPSWTEGLVMHLTQDSSIFGGSDKSGGCTPTMNISRSSTPTPQIKGESLDKIDNTSKQSDMLNVPKSSKEEETTKWKPQHTLVNNNNNWVCRYQYQRDFAPLLSPTFIAEFYEIVNKHRNALSSTGQNVLSASVISNNNNTNNNTAAMTEPSTPIVPPPSYSPSYSPVLDKTFNANTLDSSKLYLLSTSHHELKMSVGGFMLAGKPLDEWTNWRSALDQELSK